MCLVELTPRVGVNTESLAVVLREDCGHQAPFWNSPGLIPVHRLNALPKLLWSAKTSMNATSLGA